MKPKQVITVLILTLGLLLTACGKKSHTDIASDSITQVDITSAPENESYHRIYRLEESIAKITDYLNELSLDETFSEDPDTYTGMAYTITLTDNNGKQTTYIHFGNLFFKENDRPWMKMNYEQASKLDTIIQDTPSD